jgi:Domain of unknown function (DUF4160)
MTCLVFLNELSYDYEGEKGSAELVPILLSTLGAIKVAQKFRSDLLIAGSSPISKISIGNGVHSVASLLSGNDQKEEWRFIKALDQASPGGASWDFDAPDVLQEVTFEGKETFGMLWASVNHSVVLSFALAPQWRAAQIPAKHQEIGHHGEVITTDITIPNVSSPEQSKAHKDFISNYGRDEAASSVVYQDEYFVARIYFFDHDPPHFHVCDPAKPAKTLARYRIDTLDTLSGQLTGRRQRVVREWARMNSEQLMNNWSRCRIGKHAVRMDR